jgi:pyrimidine operon attenuation protein/uracil phosphoribosyltransferase
LLVVIDPGGGSGAQDAAGVFDFGVSRAVGSVAAGELVSEIGRALDQAPGTIHYTIRQHGGIVPRWAAAERDVVERLQIPAEWVQAIEAKEMQDLERREQSYRRSPPPDLTGRTVILVDHGLATGSTMAAAVHFTERGAR